MVGRYYGTDGEIEVAEDERFRNEVAFVYSCDLNGAKYLGRGFLACGRLDGPIGKREERLGFLRLLLGIRDMFGKLEREKKLKKMGRVVRGCNRCSFGQTKGTRCVKKGS